MLAELVRLTTADGLAHYGAFYPAKAGGNTDLAAVMVHGMTGSFVGEIESAVPPLLAELGYSTFVFNNRGTGIVGAATELFSGCIPDIRAGLDFIEARGFPRAALFGHSKAGAKVAYYMAQTGDARVAGLSVLSPVTDIAGIPPSFAGIFGKRNPQGWLERVRQLAAKGKGSQMFAHPAWPFIMSAGTAAEHMAAVDANTLENLGKLKLPILAACGSLELDWCQTVAKLRQQPPEGYRVAVVEGADHVYTGREQELADLMADWMNTL